MSWLFQPLLPASADLQAAASGSLDVLATRDALTLAEHSATVVFSRNVSTSSDALTLVEYTATVGFTRNITATRDALTLVEYVAFVGSVTNIAATRDALTLTEYPATIGLSRNVQASRDSLTLVEHKATVTGGSAPVVLSRAGGYEWHENDYKLRARLRKQALRQAHFEDEEETLAILLASLMRG